jgi:hypothetical protein
LIVRFDTVAAHANDDRISFRHRLNSVAEPARFLGSTRCVILRVKPKDHILSGIIAE